MLVWLRKERKNMEEFKYGIEVNGVVIAKFVHAFDRDISQEALANEFEERDMFLAVDID